MALDGGEDVASGQAHPSGKLAPLDGNPCPSLARRSVSPHRQFEIHSKKHVREHLRTEFGGLVSIRAPPRWGERLAPCMAGLHGWRFNPRPPRWGERHSMPVHSRSRRAFQSAPAPVGRATTSVRLKSLRRRVSIRRPPRWGERLTSSREPRIFTLFQSAPAPVGRATPRCSATHQIIMFQSAPAPVGRATIARQAMVDQPHVSIRARPGGASDRSRAVS